MNDLDAKLRDYVDDCTSADVPAPDFVVTGASRPHSRMTTGALPVVAAVAVTALVVAGVAMVRTDANSPASPPPASEVAPSKVSQRLVGTWTSDRVNLSDFKQATPAITFHPDGTWEGYDGCNSLVGEWRVQDEGTLAVSTKSSTDAGCSPERRGRLPMSGVYGVDPQGSRLLLARISVSDVLVSPLELYRPGGANAVSAGLHTDAGGGYRLDITTWGSSSCPFVPSEVGSDAANELSVRETAEYDGCTLDLKANNVRLPVSASMIDTSQLVSLTVAGLSPAPITIPVDTSKLAPDADVLETYDVDIALIEPGYFGNWETRGLVWHPVSIESDGGVGEATVIALLNTPSPARQTGINGMNLGFGVEPIAVVRSVEVRGGVIVVDLDREVVDPYPTHDCNCPRGEIVMQQLVWTVNGALNADLPVQVTAEGQPADNFWGHPLDGPVALDPQYKPVP